VRTEIVIDNKIMEKLSLFNCLGNMISYEGEMDIDNKLNNVLKITDILNNVFRSQENPLRKQSCYMAAKLGLLKQATPEE